jgi:hypothetical protein
VFLIFFCKIDVLKFIILPSHDVCSTLKCSPDWDENCVNDVSKFFISMLHYVRLAFKWSPKLGESCKYGNDILEFTTPTSDNAHMTLIHPPNWGKYYECMRCKNDALKLINLVLHDMCGHSFVLDGLSASRSSPRDRLRPETGPVQDQSWSFRFVRRKTGKDRNPRTG